MIRKYHSLNPVHQSNIQKTVIMLIRIVTFIGPLNLDNSIKSIGFRDFGVSEKTSELKTSWLKKRNLVIPDTNTSVYRTRKNKLIYFSKYQYNSFNSWHGFTKLCLKRLTFIYKPIEMQSLMCTQEKYQ